MSSTAHRILAVDDDPLMLAALRRHFEETGYAVATAASGLEALAAIRRDTPDLVLLDLVLPHLDGIQVCREVRHDRSYDTMPIIVLTSRAELEMKVEALRAGASDYVVKPFEFEELDARVQSQLKTKGLRDELRAMQERLVAGGKREAVIELAGAAAHEMNQPLTGILGRAALLERKLEEGHPGRRDLEIIREQAERLGRTVARLARVSSYDTTPYVSGRRILDLEQSSSASDHGPAALAVLRGAVDRALVGNAVASLGLTLVEPEPGEDLASAWSRTRAEVLVVELDSSQTASDVMRSVANELSLRDLPVVLLDPAGRAASSAVVEHLGAGLVAGPALDSVQLESSLRRAHRIGRLARRLEARERELGALRTLDPLTGVARRDHFLELLAGEVRRARRYRLPLSLALLDVDEFAEINRRWGEELGNRVLRDLALLVRGGIREVDVIGRMGDESFGVILPHTSSDDSVTAADRWSEQMARESERLGESIRQSIAGHSFGLSGQDIRLTISIGIAGVAIDGVPDPEELVARAEGALRHAKALGKNRVVVDRATSGEPDWMATP